MSSIELIRRASVATMSGSMSFPQIVKLLLDAGVSYYVVDYASMSKRFYGREGGAIAVTPITFEGMPALVDNLNVEALRKNILDSQQNNQHWRDFSRRAIESGVHFYTAFLIGKRVVYTGMLGDQHTEFFPGAGPNADASQQK